MRRKGFTWLIIVGALFLVGCNRIPSALFSVDHLDGRSPLTIMFNGTLSHDPDGEIVAYEWDFGDETYASEAQVTHTFSTDTDRNFNVRLTVTDDQGAKGSHTATIHVQGANTPPEPGEELFFDDFEDGLDSAWHTSTGWMGVDEGWLYCGDALHTGRVYAYVLDGTQWSDYAVEVDVDPRGTMAIILRCSEDLQDYVTMEATHDAVIWRVFEDREEIEASESISPGLFEGVNYVRVEVQGTQYRVYIEDSLRSQFTYDGLSKGMPGLAADPGYWNAPGPGFDYFRVTVLE